MMSQSKEQSPSSARVFSPVLLGSLAALGAIAIWSGWFIATRYGMHSMNVNALALTRFLPAVVVFMPVLMRIGLLPKGVPKWTLALMVAGSGGPYLYVAALALRYAPAAEVAPLLPGTMPLIVALISVVFLRQPLRRTGIAGFALILAGVFAIAGYHLVTTHSFALGHVLALCAAMMWASYALALPRSGLKAVEATALIGAWSALMFLPFGALPLIHEIRDGHYANLALQFLVQGVGSGIVALVCFNYAVGKLGASRASAFTALVPAMAALLAIPFLGEWPEPSAWLGIAAVSTGVLLVNWPRKAQQNG